VGGSEISRWAVVCSRNQQSGARPIVRLSQCSHISYMQHEGARKLSVRFNKKSNREHAIPVIHAPARKSEPIHEILLDPEQCRPRVLSFALPAMHISVLSP
jgi:hypothetical protein